MSTFEASVRWRRQKRRKRILHRWRDDEHPSLDHTWRIGVGPILRASAPPDAGGNVALPNAEEALVCAVASSHMLRFLELCRERGLSVQAYEDVAAARIERASNGRLAVTAIQLRPVVSFAEGAAPSYDELVTMHQLAREASPIGASLRCEVEVTPAFFPQWPLRERRLRSRPALAAHPAE